MHFFMNLSINTKLFVGFGLIIALQSVIIITAYEALSDAGASESVLFEDSFRNVYDLGSLRSDVNAERFLVSEMLLTPPATWETRKADLESRLQTDEQIIDRLIISFRRNPEEMSKLNELNAIRENYKKLLDEVKDLLYNDANISKAKEIFLGQLVATYASMRSVTLALQQEEIAEAQRIMEKDRADSRDRATAFILFGIITVLIALGFAGGMKWIISNYLREIEVEGDQLEVANRSLRLLNVCGWNAINASEENKLLVDTCKAIVGAGGYKLAWVGFAENDECRTVRPIAQAGSDSEYVDTAKISWSDDERGLGPTGTAIRTGKPVVARDTMTEPNFEPWRYDAVERGFRSSVAIPLMEGEKAFGALMIYSSTPDAFSGEELELLIELADNMACAIVALRTKRSLIQAQDELRTSCEKYRVLFDSISVGATISDDKGRILEANPASVRLLGLSESIHKQRVIDGEEWMVIRPDGTTMPPEEYASVRAMKEGRTVENVEMGIVKANNDVTWIVVTATPIHVEGYGVAITYSDITERKRAEDYLRKANAYNRGLLEASIDPLVVIGPTGKITDVNRATENLTGICRQELIGTDFADYFTEPEKAHRGLTDALSNGSVSGLKLTVKDTTGMKTDVLYNATVVRDDTGVLQGVFAAARVIN